MQTSAVTEINCHIFRVIIAFIAVLENECVDDRWYA